MTKKQKIIIGVLAVILVISISGLLVLGSSYVKRGQSQAKLISENKELSQENKELMEKVDLYVNATPTPTPISTTIPVPTKETEENSSTPKTTEKKATTDTPTPKATTTETPKSNVEAAAEDVSRETIEREHTEEEEADVLYENYIEGKKFTFEYPASWDGKVVFKNETKDDGTVLISCYQSTQYARHQAGDSLTGEIFTILVNKDANYKNSDNSQYKIASKGDYNAYYEEPKSITYNYADFPEESEDFRHVYDTQATLWRSFKFE